MSAAALSNCIKEHRKRTCTVQGAQQAGTGTAPASRLQTPLDSSVAFALQSARCTPACECSVNVQACAAALRVFGCYASLSAAILGEWVAVLLNSGHDVCYKQAVAHTVTHIMP